MSLKRSFILIYDGDAICGQAFADVLCDADYDVRVANHFESELATSADSRSPAGGGIKGDEARRHRRKRARAVVEAIAAAAPRLAGLMPGAADMAALSA